MMRRRRDVRLQMCLLSDYAQTPVLPSFRLSGSGRKERRWTPGPTVWGNGLPFLVSVSCFRSGFRFGVPFRLEHDWGAESCRSVRDGLARDLCGGRGARRTSVVGQTWTHGRADGLYHTGASIIALIASLCMSACWGTSRT